MAYLPPYNGGRINVSIGGNSAGADSLVSSGTMVLAGGNNITLSQSDNTITIRGAGVALSVTDGGVGGLSNGTVVLSNSNNVSFGLAGNSLTASASFNQSVQTQNRFNATLSGNVVGILGQISSGTLTLAGGNNITLSQNGNAITIAGESQTVQTQNLHNVSLIGNTAGAMAQVSSGTMSLAGGNNITLSQNGNAITISGGAGAALSAAGASASNGTLIFSNSNNVSFGMNGSTLTASASFSQTAQTQSNIQAIYDGANSISTGTLRLSNANGISFGVNGQTLTASHNGITSQTNQTLGIYATGANTTGQSSSNTVDARSFSISAQGGLYAGMSGNTLQLSAATTYAASNHSHGNPTLNLTNLSGTTASASNGLTLSLSAAAPGGGAAISAAGASASNGTVVFSNSNGIGFGMNGSTVTASYTTPTQTNQTVGIYATGANTTGQSSSNTLDARSFSISGQGDIYVGMSGNTVQISGATTYAASNHSHGNPTLNLTNLSGTTASASNGLTLSLSAASQTNQNLALSAVGNTTQTSTGTMNATNMYLSGAGNVSVGYSNGSAIISGGGGGGGAAISAAGASASNGTVVFSNSNGLAFGMNGSTVTGSYTTPTQTNQTLSFSAGSQSTLTATGTFDARSVFLNGVGGASVGFSNSSMFVSVNSTYAASNHSHGNPTLNLTNLSGTTASASNGFTLSLSAAAPGGGGGVALYDGVNSITSGTARFSASGALTASINGQTLNLSVPATSSLSATGAVSVSLNGSTISIGAPAFSAGISNIGNTSGTSGMQTNQLVFAGGNNITLSQSNDGNGATVSISGAAGGGGGIALNGGGTTYTSGTVNLSGAGAMTITNSTAGGGGQTYQLSVPATSSLSATGAVSIATNGGTISIGAQPVGTIARWEYPTQGFQIINTIAQSSLSLQHIQVPFNFTGSAMRLAVSFNVSSLTAAGTTGSVGLSLNVGLYSLNGSTLSSIATGSANNSFSYTSGNYVSTAYNSVREITAPLNVAASVTPGDYWVGAMVRSASSGSAVGALSVMGLGASHFNTTAMSIGVLGVNITASARDIYMGQGMYSTTTTAMPASIALSAINNTNSASGNAGRAGFYHAIYSATY